MGSRATTYVYAVFFIGVGLTAKSFGAAPMHSWLYAGSAPGVVLGFVIPACLVALAEVFPVRLAIDTKMSVSAAVSMAVLLTYPVSEAVTVIGSGMIAANLFLRRERLNVLFNVGQYLVISSVVGLTVLGLDLLNLGGHGVLVLLTASASFVLLNSTFVAGVVALHQNLDFRGQLVTIARSCWVQYGCLVLIGVMGAAVFRALPFATVLVALPLMLVHRSYEDQALLRSQTRETLEFLADVIDSRDSYTFQHSQRVAGIAQQIATAMGLTDEERELIVLAARVHDIGKLGTSAEILMKKGSLSPEELTEIHRHPVAGAGIVGKLSQYRGIRDLVLFHHKRFDCTGYPEDEEPASGRLPLGAAIIAVADSFDAMTADRPYRSALPVGAAIRELKRSSGTQFAPEVVSAFVERVLLKDTGERVRAGELVPRYQE